MALASFRVPRSHFAVRRIAAVILGALALAASSPALCASQAFAKFVDDYFDAMFRFSPSQASGAGLHAYDTSIENRSAASLRARIATLKAQRLRLDTLRRKPLDTDEAIDGEMLAGAIRSELLDLAELRVWQRNPMGYVSLPGGAIDVLIKRDFAPAPERLRAVTARLNGVPALLAAMRVNIGTRANDAPPREFTDLAIRIARGSTGFFSASVAPWAKQAAGADAQLLTDFTRANDAAAKAMGGAAEWLERELLPRSNGRFAIGAARFSAKLRYDEMVDVPLAELLAIGVANLNKDHDALIRLARELDPSKAPQQVIASLEDERPTADALLASVRDSLEDARRFVVDHRIVTLPSEVRPRVEETPPYARDGRFASMDTPGPYEDKATEAFYYVTPPEKDWDAKHVEEHLRGFNRYEVDLTNVHEAFPGHYVQFLFEKQVPTRTRKLLFVGSNIEGWAHYAEQMMIEEGFRAGDLKVRIAQLTEALIRDCRFVVGIKLHTQGMSVKEGAQCFEKQAFQQPANAYEEARRGAWNPTYLYYTLGKLEIYKLRDDYRRAKGSAYSLQGFHDDFVRQGSLPIPLMRRVMLRGGSG